MLSEVPRYGQGVLNGALDVLCASDGEVRCVQCARQLKLGQIAFMTRMSGRDPFDAWCSRCALQLCKWAIAGAEIQDLEGAAGLMRIFAGDRQ